MRGIPIELTGHSPLLDQPASRGPLAADARRGNDRRLLALTTFKGFSTCLALRET
jgi:hypothetical protein